jgi:hypothetical protein
VFAPKGTSGSIALATAVPRRHIRNMSFDISGILDNWDYEPGQVVVRKFKAKDGTEKLQLRVDLGLLQMNAHGRPDGKKPFGKESLLEHYESQLERYRLENAGDDKGFQLKPEDISKLQQEAFQYHDRYICLFQLEDFEGVIRDADRNLKAFDFAEKYATSDDFAWALQQFRPQLLMMRVRARGATSLKANNFDAVIVVIEEGLEEIRQFYRDHERSDLLDQSGEIISLEAWLEEIRAKRPMSPREKLENDLNEAVQNEDYEKAAQVRDALKNLK